MTLVMPTRVLIVGRGGREHALAWKLAAEPGVNRVVVAPGSAGIAEEPRVAIRPDVDPLDLDAVVAVARSEAVELAVVGPEQPLAAGLADALVAAGVPTFGPGRAAAQIETSKAFCHDVAAAAGVRMARATVADSARDAVAAIRATAEAGHGVVVKDDGLAGGKGVTVFDSDSAVAEAEELAIETFARAAADGRSNPRLVVEERLHGREASVIAIADGLDAIGLPVSRDHKRLDDGDHGPNTGGMGAYSPLDDLPDADVPAILDAIHRPILRELAARGTPFRGALYAGLMLTDGGPVLLECNARFGDPETQVVLPRLAGPLGPWLRAAATGRLGDALRRTDEDAVLATIPGAAVGIVLAAGTYPESPSRGAAIEGIGTARGHGALVFHAGTRRVEGRWETDGGRILTVVGRGRTREDARRTAEAAADAISFERARRRRDIGANVAAAGHPAGRAGSEAEDELVAAR